MPFSDRFATIGLSVIEDFRNEPDRHVAIMGACFVESCLDDSISLRLRNDAKATKSVFRDGMDKWSFYFKIELCYLLRVYDKDALDDFHQIRDIRNLFAHDLTEKDNATTRLLTFDSPAISELCNKLKYPIFMESRPETADHHHPQGPRNKFTATVKWRCIALHTNDNRYPAPSPNQHETQDRPQ